MDFSSLIQLIFITLLPYIELRGAIPYGVFILKLPLVESFFISTIVNILLAIPVLIVLNFVFPFLEKINFIKKMLSNLRKKSENAVQKYGFLGLLLFVAIPLPGTGAYTGCLIAKIFDIDFKKSFFAIGLGVLIAGIIISLIVFAGNSLLQEFLLGKIA